MRVTLVAAAAAVTAAVAAAGRSNNYASDWPLPPLRYPHLSAEVLAASTLRQAAAGLVHVGTALNLASLSNTSDPLYRTVSATQYDLVTAENECKFAETEQADGSFNASACAGVAAFAQGAGTLAGVFRGHNFVWGSSNPNWLLNGGYTPAQLSAIMAQHITTLAVTDFGASGFLCWDVVNEAIEDGAGTFKPAPPWYPALPNYVAQAFTTARAAVGKTGPLLFYNDYGAEDMGTKSDKVYALAQSLVSAGVLDGVGLQMHISVDSYPDPSQVAANIARLGALGLQVHITEMDVRCTPPCGADRLAKQAQIYGAILEACLNVSACTSFETWGFTDLHTWLWDFNNPTHANMQPLPFDFNYQPKPAFSEMLAVLLARQAARKAAVAAPPPAPAASLGVMYGIFAGVADPTQWTLYRIDPATAANTTIGTVGNEGVSTYPSFATYSAADNALVLATSAGTVRALSLVDGSVKWRVALTYNSSEPWLGITQPAGSTSGVSYLVTTTSVWSISGGVAKALVTGLSLPSDADVASTLSGGTANGGRLFVTDGTSSALYTLDLGAGGRVAKVGTGVSGPMDTQYSEGLGLLVELASYQLYTTDPATGRSTHIWAVPDGPGFPRVNSVSPTGLGPYFCFLDFAYLWVLDLRTTTVVAKSPFTYAPRAVGFPVWLAQ